MGTWHADCEHWKTLTPQLETGGDVGRSLNGFVEKTHPSLCPFKSLLVMLLYLDTCCVHDNHRYCTTQPFDVITLLFVCHP